jgi:cell division protein FtsI/penicillin-binding protein 2
VLRRHAVAALLAAPTIRGGAGPARLDAFLEAGSGAALLLDARTGRLAGATGVEAARRLLMPPGSTLKPIVLAALLRSGKLAAGESFPCSGRLRLGTRQLDCVHPPILTPMRADLALAYSCNCFVAHAASRFRPGELAAELERAGLAARTALLGPDEATGRIAPVREPRLQALGQDGVLITALELAAAYRRLAMNITRPHMQPVLAGLEGAVDFGTAQRARIPGMSVAGKTGSALATQPVAWFAGFVPSRAPEAVVVVMLHGRSGGADAAPVAGRILAEHRAGRL